MTAGIIIFLVILLLPVTLTAVHYFRRTIELGRALDRANERRREITNFLSRFSTGLQEEDGVEGAMHAAARHVAEQTDAESVAIYEVAGNELRVIGVCGTYPLIHSTNKLLFTRQHHLFEALRREHEETLKRIARYEDILNNYDSMAGVIIEDLDRFKKEYARKRRTAIENAAEAVFEEKKIEEQEVVFLMDRFGYAKTVDVSVYERNKEAADSESRYVVHCMNTGKLCVFTDAGRMHQVRVLDLPYGRFREKGTPIDNVSNYSTSEEQIVMVCDAEQMRFANLLFATAQGMIKKVEGTEFQVSKRTIAATKLQEEDSLIAVKVVNDSQNIVLQTKNGYFLRFPAEEVPVKKKAAVGVRGIRLQKKDELENVYLFEEGTETKILYGEKEVTLNRLKAAKRDGAGTKYRG